MRWLLNTTSGWKDSHDPADGVIPSPLRVVPPKRFRLDSNPNVGTFVSHEKKHVRKSLNALSVLNGRFDNLCAGQWLISCLFVTTDC